MPRPQSSTPALLDTASSSSTPASSNARISAAGTPHSPKPPTARVLPEGMSATASAAEGTVLSIIPPPPSWPAVPEGPGDRCRAAVGADVHDGVLAAHADAGRPDDDPGVGDRTGPDARDVEADGVRVTGHERLVVRGRRRAPGEAADVDVRQHRTVERVCWTSTRGGRGTPISSRSGFFTDAIVVPVAGDARRACPAREAAARAPPE